jgi:hypothetical protein
MKSKFRNYIIILASLFLLTISCTKDKIVNNSAVLLYKNISLKDSSSAGYLLGSSVKEVSKIEYNNTTFDSLKIRKDWESIVNSNHLDFKNISLTSYFGTKISLLTIPIINPIVNGNFNYINIYVLNNKYVITKFSISNLKNLNRKIVISTMDDKLYYQLEINKDNKIGKWSSPQDIPLTSTFNQTINNTNIHSNSLQSNESFYKCMSRLITQVCGSDWVCAAMCGLALPSCIAGAALACAVN